ncbi:MAG: hypothetical protein H7Y38_15800 [Armatimonadetes bacterium]|nr:hypothetical protein [Armatimonadota bacterium]
MITALALVFSCVLAQPVTNPVPGASASAPGVFRDEMDSPFLWGLPGSANDPFLSSDVPGVLTMTMPQVAAGYPHSYQWGAATRTVVINTDAAPLLIARVSQVSDGAYAHLDVEMRDYAGVVVKSARSSTVQGAGFVSVNLREQFGTGLLRVTIRLIVGGANSGAWVDYDYLRAVSIADFTTLQNAPVKKSVTPPVAKRKRRK